MVLDPCNDAPISQTKDSALAAESDEDMDAGAKGQEFSGASEDLAIWMGFKSLTHQQETAKTMDSIRNGFARNAQDCPG